MSLSASVFWYPERPSYPTHDAFVTIRRDLGDNLRSGLLALTEVINALIDRVPTRAIFWLPGAISSVRMFKEGYDALYDGGSDPVSSWVLFIAGGVGMPPGMVGVATVGLAEWGIPEIEFETPEEDFEKNVSFAYTIASRLIKLDGAFPDGTELGIDADPLHGVIRMTLEADAEREKTVCRLAFSYFAEPPQRSLPR